MTNVGSLLERSSNTLIMGSIIQGRYQVLNKIKGGALSRTYLAQDVSQPHEPKCVLKHYPYNKEIPRLYKTNMRLFLKEVKHLQLLSVHPQIPRLIDYFGVTDQGWYLVQEMVEGRLISATLPMSEYSGNCWNVQEVARLIHDVCEPLQFIHSQKIIHCDLKPNNLIRRASDGRIVIIDFGGAQYMLGFQTNEDAMIASLRTKITVSPSGYLAPEQLNGQPKPSSDIYALGIMAIQAWTGLDPARMKKDVHTGELVWDQYVKIENPEASRHLVGIISRMVHPDLGDRYRNTHDILNDLDVLRGSLHLNMPEKEIDYTHIAFDDTSLFKKPEPAPNLLPVVAEIPSKLAEITVIQGDVSEKTIFQTEPVDFFQDAFDEAEIQLAENTTTADITPANLPAEFKRRKSPINNLSFVAMFSVSVVIVNAFLIAFGLQHLISNMATTDTPPDDDFQRAQDAYAQGDLQEAIAIAKAIPQQNVAYAPAQEAIATWQAEWQIHAQQVEAITLAHTAQNWQEVVALSKTLGNNALAREKVNELVTEAQFQIDVAAYKRVQKSFELATNYDFVNALATLKDAPPNSKFAEVIAAKLVEYETKKQVRAHYYLQQAVNHAEAREFKEAVAFLQQIPVATKHHAIAEIKIVEYTEKQAIKEAYDRWVAAQPQSQKTKVKLVNTPIIKSYDPADLAIASVNPGMQLNSL